MTQRSDSSARPASSEQPAPLFDTRFLAFLGTLIRPYWRLVLLAVVFLVVAAATELGIGKALSNVIDHGFNAKPDGGSIDRHFMVLYVLVVIFGVAVCCRIFFVNWIGEKIAADVRKKVYGHIVGLSSSFFERARIGDLLSRLTDDINVVRQMLTSSASDLLKSAFLAIGGVTLLTITSPKLAGIVFMLVPIIMVPIILFGRYVRGLSRTSQQELGNVLSRADETLRAIHTVHAFTQEDAERQSFASHVQDSQHAAVRFGLANAVFSGWIAVGTLSLVTAVLWIGASDVKNGLMSPGDLTAFVIYSLMLASSVGSLSNVWGSFQRAAGAADRLLELLETKSDIVVAANPRALPAVARSGITFDEVTFHYPTRPEMPSLHEFSLDIEPGETVALVGPSGAGKSTVFNLILRFYDPQIGRVQFDGVDIRNVDLRQLRNKVGLVAQEPVMFGTTIAENIRYGRPEASMEDVIRVARAAAADEFIQRLPNGYDTKIGDRGVLLSGGQRQRLAIARAILIDAPVILFDEATSSLDSHNERLVQLALQDVMQQRTTVIIAHRLATVVRADRIVVMEAGRIVDVGTHAELLERCELYDHLAKLQFDLDSSMMPIDPLPATVQR